MSLFTLGVFAWLTGTAELGGTIVAEHVARPLPSPVPVTARLYDGALPVATATAGLDGSYALSAPPGNYWLQITVGGVEVHAERVSLRGGSWRKDLELDPGLPWAVAPPEDVVAVR